jgi:molybdopterin synthase sulfur carrier subunit
MLVRTRYFAALREQAGISTELLEIAEPRISVAALQERLAARNPALAEAFAAQRALRVSVDYRMCGPEFEIIGDCEVAFFPPVTGG